MKISRNKIIALLCEIRKTIYQNIDLQLYFDDVYSEDNTEQTELEDFCNGVSNGFLSELIHAISGYEVEVTGDVENLFICPCCKYKTLSEKYDINECTGYDICPYCWWEDDGTVDINKYSSVNRGSISDYRERLKLNPNKYYIDKWFK